MSHSTPSSSSSPMVHRQSVRLLLLGCVIAACTSTPPAGLGDGVDAGDVDPEADGGAASCLRPEEGCPCSVTAPLDCYLDATRTATTDVICHRGSRYCRAGHWSGCESIVDYTIDTSNAVVSPPSAANPCDPRDFGNLLTPDPGDAAMGTNTIYNPMTGGITITSTTGTTAPPGCVPSVTACPAGYNCGSVSNGCGGTVSCGTCAAGSTCGGSGVAFHCGSPAAACTAHGCGTANCGPVDDGCGNLTASCGMCVAPQSCGVGMPSRCGIPGQVLRCSQPSPPAICGLVPTCPNAVTTSMTTASTTVYDFEASGTPTGWTAGSWSRNTGQHQSGSAAFRSPSSGTNTASVSATSTAAGSISFGLFRDANTTLHFYIDGTEQGTGWSGGAAGWITVGPYTFAAGTHTFNWTASRTSGSGRVWIDNVSITTSATTTTTTGGSQATTTIRGVVTVPGHDDIATWGSADPLNNVNVFIPGSTPAAFTTSVACESCAATLSGDPVARATTDLDGNFTLTDVPCGANIPLVIQLGRWRRQVTIPNVTCCATTTLPSSLTHLPRNRTEGDIPRIAMVTGNVDAMECVLRKIGIEDAEFTTSSGTGRVHIYQSNGASGGAGTAAASTLWSSLANLRPYDMVLLACEGGAQSRTQAEQQAIIDYANSGGRVFATHFHYTWLTNTWTGVADPTTGAPAPFSGTANWNTDYASVDSLTTTDIDTSFPRGTTFAQWLYNRGAATMVAGGYQVQVGTIRDDTSSIIPPAQQWLSTANLTTDVFVSSGPAFTGACTCGRFSCSCGGGQTCWNIRGSGNYCGSDPICSNPADTVYRSGGTLVCGHYNTVAVPRVPVHYTFDTPIGSAPASQCGRVAFSDFHVYDARTGSSTFPDECSDGTLSPQERVLEYMLFDLASCITASPCVPRTCAQQGRACGQAADGCGGTLDCGSCAAGDSCGGGGTPGMCGHPNCTPVTCASSGAACGTQSDGCSGTISCPCTFYQPTATYTHVYASQPTPCTIDECPAWGGFSYTVDVPAGTYVEFLFQSSNSATGFPNPPTAVLRVNPPATGTSVTGTADIAALLNAAGARTGEYFLQVSTVLHADATLMRAPTLQSSNVQFTCVPCS